MVMPTGRQLLAGVSLLVSSLCAGFGPGFQMVGVSSIIQLVLLLFYLDTFPNIFAWIPAILFQSLGIAFAFAGIFSEEKVEGIDYAVVFGISVALNCIMFLCAYLPYFRFRMRYGGDKYHVFCNHLSALVLPTFMTSLYYFASFSPSGDIFSIAYSQMGHKELVMFASLFGTSGICFVVVWGSTILFEFIIGIPKKNNEMDFVDPSRDPARPVIVFLGILALVLLFGGFWTIGAEGTFFQKPIQDTLAPTLQVGCVTWQGNETAYLLENTEKLAKEGSKIILWSETAIEWLDDDDVASLHKKVSALARKYEVFIGATYTRYIENSTSILYNVLALFNEKGNLSLTYNKAHPVPIVESNIQAGPDILQFVDTKYGRLGVAICFDFNYPNFLAQAGREDVDIMLQVAQTWGSIGKYVTKANSFRSVEQGFHTFRCSSWGYSGIFGPTYETPGFQGVASNGTAIFELPLDSRVSTFYGLFNDIFVWFCVAMCVFYLWLCLPERWIDPCLARLNCFSKLPIYGRVQ